jgi:hypothetical protein
MAGKSNATPVVDAATVRLLAATNGLDLTPERVAALAPYVPGILAAGEALSALDLSTLPAAGLPWAPFDAAVREEDNDGA